MSDFKQLQDGLMKAIRSRRVPDMLSSIEVRRLSIYQDLFFNNIEGLLGNGFPVLKKVLGKERWHELVKGFLEQHRCRTPLFPRVGGEFVQWLLVNEAALPYPFVTELAHYEYMEVLVDTADCSVPEKKVIAIPEEIDEQEKFCLNPTAVLLQYCFPVHLIGPEYLPRQPETSPTHLLVYRKHNHQVRFLQLTAANHFILQNAETSAMRFSDIASLFPDGLDEGLAKKLREQLFQFVDEEVLCFAETCETGDSSC
ncbi:MAG: putative DNA-binding domain-containing protein [Pseudomonadales bacterium]|nr:putative DNA-binding domain-containing protein [Pseudomonadales bacterium]